MTTAALIIIIIGIFCGFFVQTVVGFAGALVAMPILLFVLDLPEAISYITIFYAIASIYLVYIERKNINRKVVLRLIISSFIGTGIGTSLLTLGSPDVLKRALGVFIIAYVIYAFFNNNKKRNWSKLEFLFGLLGGFFSGLFSIGGPLYVIIVKNVTPDINTFRATMFGVLGAVTFIRIPFLTYSGVMTLEHLYYSLYILPFFILAIILGKKMYSVLNENLLKKGLLALLLVSGIVLTF
ncbi:sulfite exporter TauE/SafE family protein [Winogradskyella immobilis]|uniref:Probable membrane transporter protein n=1 Tax=Winogradskyella immobilis TaxID=2816852 RepID=A0ABS8EPT7_9FLAO|nr:sulfite exporter TauE/SafE family protein [Winogradskyella immobilis]MCC1484580.1 sulfite exporter TauE/SafE family protein [Winogradskyella immobilis]MCG0016672.1 sulfite exporter TauE/SafE family protein [Winogradskyella immobilis]